MSCKEMEASQQVLKNELTEKEDNIKCLQKTIEDLQTTKKIIESKMKTSEHSLKQQINSLQAEKDRLLQRSRSPLMNGSVNSPTKQRLLDENDVLKVVFGNVFFCKLVNYLFCLQKKNQNLCVELDKERKLSLSSRKTRRQSTHDERRSFNPFGSSNDVEIQTDPASKLALSRILCRN